MHDACNVFKTRKIVTRNGGNTARCFTQPYFPIVLTSSLLLQAFPSFPLLLLPLFKKKSLKKYRQFHL